MQQSERGQRALLKAMQAVVAEGGALRRELAAYRGRAEAPVRGQYVSTANPPAASNVNASTAAHGQSVDQGPQASAS
jgi:hypothetical protein